MDENRERTLQEAARWHARLQADDCGDAERAAFERWHSEPEHAHAMGLARRVDAHVDALARADHFQALADEAYAAMRAGQPHRATRWVVPAALAASVAMAAVMLHYSIGRDANAAAPVVYAASNALRSITLSDGSVVRLDIDSEVRVRMTNGRRHIALIAGRAYFEVAHDAARPFVVSAASSSTTALGTRFQVERSAARVTVTLTEGSVAVRNDGGAEASPTWEERLTPGEQLRIESRLATPRKLHVDAQVATGWTRGRHVFRGTPLAEALDEVNRYATTKIRLGDPSLADLEVAGSFIAGDSEAIVAAFAAVLPLRSVAAGEKEIILFRRYDDSER